MNCQKDIICKTGVAIAAVKLKKFSYKPELERQEERFDERKWEFRWKLV